jgi:hypothetical protein
MVVTIDLDIGSPHIMGISIDEVVVSPLHGIVSDAIATENSILGAIVIHIVTAPISREDLMLGIIEEVIGIEFQNGIGGQEVGHEFLTLVDGGLHIDPMVSVIQDTDGLLPVELLHIVPEIHGGDIGILIDPPRLLISDGGIDLIREAP